MFSNLDSMYKKMGYEDLMKINELITARISEERAKKVENWKARLKELLSDIENSGAFIELTEDKYNTDYLWFEDLDIHF